MYEEHYLRRTTKQIFVGSQVLIKKTINRYDGLQEQDRYPLQQLQQDF